MIGPTPSIVGPALAEAERIEAGGAIVANDVASMLRNLAVLVAEQANSLHEERTHSTGLTTDCEEMCNRLSRLEHHLRDGVLPEMLATLADYAGSVGHEDRDDPPRDPFPEPKTVRRRTRRKA